MVSDVRQWKDDDLRVWLYMLCDEMPSDKVGPQTMTGKKFVRNLLTLYDIDRTPHQCMHKVQVVINYLYAIEVQCQIKVQFCRCSMMINTQYLIDVYVVVKCLFIQLCTILLQ